MSGAVLYAGRMKKRGWLLVLTMACAPSYSSPEHISEGASNPLTQITQRKSKYRGRIVERIDAGPYRYLRIRSNAQERWVATMGRTPQAGDVLVRELGRSERFESKRLSRIFSPLSFGFVSALETP